MPSLEVSASGILHPCPASSVSDTACCVGGSALSTVSEFALQFRRLTTSRFQRSVPQQKNGISPLCITANASSIRTRLLYLGGHPPAFVASAANTSTSK